MAKAGVQVGQFVTSEGKLSHFSVAELMCPCCSYWAPVEQSLVDSLEQLRLMAGVPIHVTSGYRCPAHNKAVGGVEFSRHMQGLAADVKVEGLSVWHVTLLALRCFHRIIIYPNKFLHVDEDTSTGFGVVMVRVGDQYKHLHDFMGNLSVNVVLEAVFGKF